MEYAREAHRNLDDGCLPGTRMEVIDTIVHWAARAALPLAEPGEWRHELNPDARVLWVCGVSGAGKSTIMRSVASRLEGLGRLGTFYGFSDATQATTNPNTLFSTIARDLAERDSLRRERLVQSIKKDKSIRTTTDCRLQFQHFIIAPSSDLPTVGDTVLVIDAFDESGTVEARRHLLSILTREAERLPPGFRVIITSRHEQDVQDAFEMPCPKGCGLLLLQDIPDHLTCRDIETFVYKTLEPDRKLKHLHPEKKQLALHAEQSFQWASTACRFILGDTKRNAGLSHQERLHQLLISHPTLDGLYTTILDRQFSEAAEIGRRRLNQLLAVLVCALEPVSLRTLTGIIYGAAVPSEQDIDVYQEIVRLLASLISGAENFDTPLIPLHTSFADFLRDQARSKGYFVDTKTFLRFLTVQCFAVMQDGLRFNICRIPTSFKRNIEFKEQILSTLNKQPSLPYACRFWARHLVQHVLESKEDAEISAILLAHLQARVLEWIEAMSLLGCSPHDVLLELGDLVVSYPFKCI